MVRNFEQNTLILLAVVTNIDLDLYHPSSTFFQGSRRFGRLNPLNPAAQQYIILGRQNPLGTVYSVPK